MTILKANGLLGGSVTAPSKESTTATVPLFRSDDIQLTSSDTSEQPKETMIAFKSNGLLASSPQEPPQLSGPKLKLDAPLSLPSSNLSVGTVPGLSGESNESVPTEATGGKEFQANALLSSMNIAPTSLASFSYQSTRTSPAYQVDSTAILGAQLRPNGLLTGKAIASTLTHFDISSRSLSTSQDDDLPTVSDLLRPRSPRANPVFEDFGAPSNLRIPLPTHIPRIAVRARTFEGETLYMKRKTRIEGLLKNATQRASVQSIGNLLDVPIHRLMEELSAKTTARLNQVKPSVATTASTTAIGDTLWVDRYRPHRFTELMGNERAARDTLTWVKQWDWCVFGKKRGKKRLRQSEGNADTNDEYHRPQEKLLLLSGPPGLGKTTLAHVIAHQAGYEVMEINASDARSGQIIDDRVRPALESGSAVGSSKPVLLIIDEIDGATGAGENSSSFIHKLVQLTFDKPRKKARPGQKSDPKTKRPLLRPIICICNDQNASSLAKLRPHAYHIKFSRPSDTHTVKRLREVCEIEGLKATARALATLVGVAKGDLRACLNTLQFIKTRNEEVTEAVVRGATVGLKDGDSSAISVLNSLFSPLSKKRVKELAMGEEEELRYVSRLSREVDGSGRESIIAIGCFAHYATLRQHDANFSRYEKANEWLMTFDVISGAMYTDGDFALSSYLPYLLVPFYPLFQERGGQRVERSQADWEHTQRAKANDEIYKSLSRCLRTASVHNGGDFRHLVSTPILQLEFTPYINRIISPPLRPVNSQVIRPVERSLLTRLVEIMTSLELRFVQERAEDGQLSYRLDPPIDVFITYDGKRAPDINVSRYAVRHLVAGEIDTKLITRQADAVEKGTTSKLDYFRRNPTYKMLNEKDGENTAGLNSTGFAGPPSKRPRLDITDIADKPPTDFFGRPITVQSTQTTKAAARKNVEKKYRVTYRFNEGNSAAVRRPVKIEAFL